MDSEEYLIERTFYGFFEFNENHIFRNNISLINYDTAEEIATGMTRTGEPFFSRFIVIVPEVDKLEEVSNFILAVGMLVLIGTIKLIRTFKPNNSLNFYKEVLK